MTDFEKAVVDLNGKAGFRPLFSKVFSKPTDFEKTP
jgi:hypothetical protein